MSISDFYYDIKGSKKDEKPPKIKYIRGNPEYYIINTIVDKKKIGKKYQYKVKNEK